jgi:hypothetical protein
MRQVGTGPIRPLIAVAAVAAIALFACGSAPSTRGGAASPARTASAGPWITLSVTSGPTDRLFRVIGGGFPPYKLVDLYWDGNTSVSFGSPGFQVDEKGGFTKDTSAPPPVGSHKLCAAVNDFNDHFVVVTCAQFTVTAVPHRGCPDSNVPKQAGGIPKVWLSAVSGPPTTTLTITGTGFPPGEGAGLYMDGPSIGGFMSDTPTADRSGTFCRFVYIPGLVRSSAASSPWISTPPGPHEVCADTGYPAGNQPVQARACAVFVVTDVP